MRQKVSLGSLDRVCQAFLEDELIVLTNCDADHQGPVSRQLLELSRLDELTEEEVFGIHVIVANYIFDHDHGVVCVCLLEGWQKLR